MIRYKTITAFCAIIALFMSGILGYPRDLFAAPTLTLSTNELQYGQFFDIFGTGFGAIASSYSFVCFGSTNFCVSGRQISAQPPMSWSDTQIHMQLPSSTPIEGEIIVIGESTGTTCNQSGQCQTTSFHQDKGRVAYKVRPSIDTVIPAGAVKPGDTLKIVGNGFGDDAGSVYFDEYQSSILSWGYTSIDVRVPSSISSQTRTMRVVSKNVLQADRSQTVSAQLTNDELSYQQYYLDQINVRQMWRTPSKKDVIVAVLDDGVYANHPDLSDHMWQNKKELPGNGKDDDQNGFIDDYLGYNFLDNSASIDPKGGHGTFVAGIIGAVRNNGIGIAGIADKVKIMPVIISDGKNSTPDLVKKGIEYAIDNGADIINISFASVGTLGFFQKDNEIYQKAFDKDVILVVASGNRDIVGGIGQNLNLIPESPVCNNNNKRIMLGVAALDNTDAASAGRKKASWSSYGSNCVVVSAPGSAIVSTAAPLYQKDKKFYDIQDGSSFASPIVAGVAAYLKSVNPEWKNYDIMNRITSTAENIDPYNIGLEGHMGGRIDAAAALERSLFFIKAIEFQSPRVRAGEKTTIKIPNYFSDYSLRLTDKRSTDAPIQGSVIEVNAADTVIIPIPSTLPSGSYYVRALSSAGNEVGISDAQIIVQDALPVTVPQSPITVQTFLVPSFSPPESISKPAGISPTEEPPFKPTILPQKQLAKLKGTILLQVQSKGEAWYLYPQDLKRYYLGRPSDAFAVMRKLGLGVTHDFITSYSTYPAKVAGRILIDTQDSGKAYYINSKDRKAYYLGRPSDAFDVMRRLGIGITNVDLKKIAVGQ